MIVQSKVIQGFIPPAEQYNKELDVENIINNWCRKNKISKILFQPQIIYQGANLIKILIFYEENDDDIEIIE